MKHLLILISILLLSSPVIGDSHKGETLYRWDTSSGIVWKGFGDKDTNPVYKGEVKNGKPDGLGLMIYPFGKKYVGEWKDGKYHDKGTETFDSGGKYVGTWFYGMMKTGTLFDKNGKSIMKWKNGKVVSKP